MNRLVALLLAALLAGGLGLFGTYTLVVRDGDSALATDLHDGALASTARGAGLDVARVTSTPLAALREGLEEPQRTLLVVLDAPRPYTPQEVEGLHAFLRDGGRVLLADPYGHTNGLTAPLGLMFERVRLVIPEPNATTAELDGVTYRVDWTLPSAVRLAPGSDATVLAWSTGSSYLDRDGNGTIDAAEPRGLAPVAAAVDVGSRGGRLVLVADRGLLTAPSSDRNDNAAWREAMLDHLLPEGGVLLVDESRGGPRGPLLGALAAVHTAATLDPWRVVLGVVGAALLLLPLLPDPSGAWRPHEFKPGGFVRRAHLLQPRKEAGATVATGSGWTRRGAAALATSGALMLLGLVLRRPEAAGAGAILAAALGTSLLARAPRLEGVRWTSNGRPDEGSTVEVRISILGRTRRRTPVQVLDPLPDSFRLVEGSNLVGVTPLRDRPVEVSYSCSPTLRGPHQIGPLVAQTTDLLGLRVRRSVLAPPSQAEVAPRQESVRRIPFATKVPTVTLGPHHVNRAGDGSEFHALRDYVQGDSLRSVNWKASARAGGLVVNQRVHESMTRLTIFLDARAVGGAGPADATPLTDGCRAAISVAAGALRVRDRVHVVVYGDGVTEVPEAPGSQQLHQLREVLARVAPAGTTGLADAVAAVGARLKPRTPVMVLSGLESDDGFADAVRDLRNRGLLPMVVASPVWVEPPEGGAPEEGAAAILASRDRTVAELQAMGVPVYETTPGLPLDHLFRLGGVA